MWYNYPEITFEQFKKYVLKEKDMKEEFPKDDFGVIVENNAKEIIDYLVNKGFKNLHDFFCSNNTGMYRIIGPYIKHCNTFSKKYTLNQLKQLDNMKEIIGYKLIKPEYKEAARKIASLTYGGLNSDEVINNATILNDFRKAGVLDIWFEPVYKTQEKVISMGSFNLTVKPEGIFHKNTEDITKYVEQLVNYYTLNPLLSDKKYKCEVKEIEFSVNGCQTGGTKLSHWVNCWEEYLKIKQ